MGGSNNVCSDKTGTLTQNKMTVVAGYIEGETYTDIPLNEKIMNLAHNTKYLMCEG
jgi:P-type E1-E2 ATPase